jgi:peptide/nickel transport system substrate-binding protein
MNRIDRAVIAGLVLAVAIAAFAIGGPAFSPASGPSAPAPSTPSAVETVSIYTEGVLGRPTSVNPLAARTQADRDLVALVFEGLVTLGPGGEPRPALARSWAMAADGSSWTFHLRPDAHWHDGEPVTADDVAFTVATIQDPDYHGPGAGSWTGIKATVVDPLTVRFDLDQPIGDFIDLATQPIAPAHLLADIPAGAMADDLFGSQPVGSGPYALVELDKDHAVLEPAASVAAPADTGEPSSRPSVDPLATVRPTPHAAAVEPAIGRIDLRFFDDPTALAAAFRAGQLDAVSGLDPAAALALADVPGSRILRDPATTLTAVALNLRPSHPEFSDSRTRSALLTAIDRARVLSVAYGGLGTSAAGLIPPSSWAFDGTASPPIARNLAAAARTLKDAGWVKAKDGWHAGKAKSPEEIQLLVPDHTISPILFAVGSQVAADWQALGFPVSVMEVDPAVLAADRLRSGDFAAAVVSVSIGHDPDLYPLLASSQTRTGGANVFGLQDPTLDGLLETARQPGGLDARKAAFSAVQKRLAAGSYVLPIAWPDTVVVLGKRVQGTAERPLADGSERFWDVLDWRLADDR